MSAKFKSAVSEAPNAKVSPATPRLSKSIKGVSKSDADSPSSLQKPRLTIDRSPRSLPSKPAVGRSPKLTTPPEKKMIPTLIPKPSGSELQSEINQLHEDLKRAKDELASLKKEKERALDDLKEAQRLAEDANTKLKESLMAQKRAEEKFEIERFRAVEMEQASIEAAQKKEDEWQKELEAMRNQQAVDVAALLTATQETQNAMQEVASIREAKDQALCHADDIMKLAEAHAKKIDLLSAELTHLKSAVESRSEIEARENNKMVYGLRMEIDSLKQQLVKATSLEETLAEKEAAMEQLSVDLEAAQMAESYARCIADELHKRVEELSSQAEQAKRLERIASETLESVVKQLGESNASLQEAKIETEVLKEKVGLLEISMHSQKNDLEEAGQRFKEAKTEASEMGKAVESLRSELETVKEERNQSLNNEKLAAASVVTLLEEKNMLITELRIFKDEDEKSKKALESLASALHEVSSEGRAAKEKLLLIEVEHENYESQLEDLKMVLKATNEKYDGMLEEARQEIEHLTGSMQKLRFDHESSNAEWEQKELHLKNTVKKCKEENSYMDTEINRLINLLKTAEEQASVTRVECDGWKNSLKETESEAVYLKEVIGEVNAETMKLKEGLIGRENELQNLLHDNEELRKREALSLGKVVELSKLLEEALLTKNNNNHNIINNNNIIKQEDANGELTDSEDYHMLAEVVEFSEQNGTACDLRVKVVDREKKQSMDDVKFFHKVVNSIEKIENETNKEKEKSDSAEVDVKMWESCKIEKKDFSPEHESLEDELDLKTERTESFDQVNNEASVNIDNGVRSPSKEQQSSPRKKKALLRKFGNLLKKKSMTTQR